MKNHNELSNQFEIWESLKSSFVSAKQKNIICVNTQVKKTSTGDAKIINAKIAKTIIRGVIKRMIDILKSKLCVLSINIMIIMPAIRELRNVYAIKYAGKSAKIDLLVWISTFKSRALTPKRKAIKRTNPKAIHNNHISNSLNVFLIILHQNSTKINTKG